MPVPFAVQFRAWGQIHTAARQIYRALPHVFCRQRAVEQTLALRVEITQQIGLMPVSQDSKQKMAGNVRVRSPAEYRMPARLKVADVEIAQAGNLHADSCPVRRSRTDLYPRHGR
jgi:hypothetical protein